MARTRNTSWGRRLQAVPATQRQQSLSEVLTCKDRAIGHDWAHDIVWEDGPAVQRYLYLTFRYCRCVRCGTVRKETFVQDDRHQLITKERTAYQYSEVWRDYERLEQAAIRHQLKGSEDRRNR